MRGKHDEYFEFLIANAELEIRATPTKQTTEPTSNRKWIAILQFSSPPPIRSGLVTKRETTRRLGPLITPFLIYCSAIRSLRKALKT